METLNLHRDFFQRYGISAFYGDQSDFARLSIKDKRAYFRELGLDPKLADRLQAISCIGLALRCLDRDFKATGQSEVWNRLSKFTRLNAQDGKALQFGLRKLGWKVLYWNPDVRYNAEWDASEKAQDPENKNRWWGYHEYRWILLQRNGSYYMNPVDDARSLVNFGTNVPKFFKRVPFFLGTAHTGYHVFPGTNGSVIEGHSVRNITSHDMIESSKFNLLAEGGGPNGAFRSGLIAIPPGVAVLE